MNHPKSSLVLLAATTLVVAACSSSNKDRAQPPAAAVNQPPTIAVVADQAGDQDTAIGPITFAVSDQETDAALLTATAVVTDGATIFPADGVVVSGTGAARSITLTPFEAATGTAMIGLIVKDPDGATATRAFKVTVNARNASIKTAALDTFAKAESDEPTQVNGFTFAQDADDEATFEALIPPEAP
jgi:hypothetical protein